MLPGIRMKLWQFGMSPIRNRVLSVTLLLFLVHFGAMLGPAQSVGGEDGPIRFDESVRPLFEKHCMECHGPSKQISGLRLDARESPLRGGDFGEPAIVPGKSGESPLYIYIKEHDHSNAMPPRKDGRRPLDDSEVEIIRRWIDEGAVWGDASATVDLGKLDHWSFRPLQRTFEADSVDGFLAKKRDESGLATAPLAAPHQIVRRLHFNLHGLPPTPSQVEEFTKDWKEDPDKAVAIAVDRLLASPQYGERWARHWLDVVRFAESDGFEMNHPRPSAWHYRDYVIESWNGDEPFDAFIRNQIAGDRYGVDRATGFLVGGPWDRVKSPDPVLTANQRADELHDMVSVTGTAFLGLTIGCARCHSHKFDPISQVDYYRVKACLSGVQHGERELKPADHSEREAQAIALRKELGIIDANLQQLHPIASPEHVGPSSATQTSNPVAGDAASARGVRAAVSHRENVDRFRPITARYLRFEIFATTGGEPCIDELEIVTSSNINVARDAKVTSSGDFPNNAFHRLNHINDGLYGNSHSWISNSAGKGQLDFDLGMPVELQRVHWSRDRTPEPQYADRVVTEYSISVSLDGETWTTVANHLDRLPRNAAAGAVPDSNLGLTDEEIAKATEWRKRKKSIEQEVQKLVGYPRAYVGVMGKPESVARFSRGDPTQPREAVAPGSISALGGFELGVDSSDLDRRVALAEWIAASDNPLTARVIVNRLWHYHFGVGIVDTPSDFGAGGGRPSHPELLDWLAVRLIENRWSIKSIQRLICNSHAYRQASLGLPEGLVVRGNQVDSSNRLLWHFPSRRLEAEPLRDTILAMSGKLSLQAGGPGFDLFEPNSNYVRVYESKTKFGDGDFRRMVYQNKPRVELDQLFGAFDCPDAGQIQPRRNVSTTPLQALNLLNSQFILDQSKWFAERLRKEGGSTSRDQIRAAFLAAFSRLPEVIELEVSEAFIQSQGLEEFCRAIFNTNEFIMVY